MWTGKRFQLKTACLGIEVAGNVREPVRIPAGEILVVTSGPTSTDSRMLDVLWNGRSLVMFVEDIKSRARDLG
jgi:hypothetical protein